jgi:hypothetical protein
VARKRLATELTILRQIRQCVRTLVDIRANASEVTICPHILVVFLAVELVIQIESGPANGQPSLIRYFTSWYTFVNFPEPSK